MLTRNGRSLEFFKRRIGIVMPNSCLEKSLRISSQSCRTVNPMISLRSFGLNSQKTPKMLMQLMLDSTAKRTPLKLFRLKKIRKIDHFMNGKQMLMVVKFPKLLVYQTQVTRKS